MMMKLCKYFRAARLPVMAALLLAVSSYGRLVPEELKNLDGEIRLVQPVQMAVLASGDKIAIADRFLNRIVIISHRGEFLKAIGENVKIEAPEAVALTSDNDILFTKRNLPLVFKIRNSETEVIDTVADLQSLLKREISIRKILEVPTGGYLLLDGKSGELFSVDEEWKKARSFINNGQGKGMIWSPAQAAIDFSGKVFVADLKNYPVQGFTAEGKFLFFGGWDQPGMEKSWEASAIAIDRQERIIAADRTNSCLRLFDPGGREMQQVELGYAPANIISMLVTPDGQLYLIDEFRGLLRAAWEE